MLSEAEDAFEKGSYEKARKLAEQAKSKTVEIDNVFSSISKAKSAIAQEKSKGFDVTEAESLLSEAEDAFEKGSYEKALEIVSNAKVLALDVDQDGVTNEKDFVPTIKNNYIYTGIGTIIFLIAFPIAFIYVRKKVKIEKEKGIRIREEQIKKERERNEIEALVVEIEKTIKNGISHSKDPVILGGLKILAVELSNIFSEFKSNINSYTNVKVTLLDLMKQAEIISRPIYEETKRTYYDILGVKCDATQEQIRSIYRKLSRIYHPDIGKNLGVRDDKRFKEINEAYRVLSDKNKRREYDKKIGLN